MAKQFIKTPDGWKVIDNPDAPWDVSRMIGQPVRGNPPSVPAPQPQAPVLPPKQAGILQVGQGPQAPQTPLGAAMSSVDVSVPPVNELDITAGQAPQVSPGILNVPQAPAAAPAPSRGILESIPGRKDANSIYDGLLQGGAAMLGGRNFREGLSHGLSAFGTEYDRSEKDALVAQKANQPKVTPLADGAFSMISYPDGRQPSILPNKDVQKFLEDQKKLQAQTMADRIILTGAVQSVGNDVKGDQKQADELDSHLRRIAPQRMSLQQALTAAQSMKPGENFLNAPGVKQVAEAFGYHGADALRQLAEVKVDEALAKSALSKGAISDTEMRLFNSPAPSDTASPEVWTTYLQRKLEALDKVEKFTREQRAGIKTSLSADEVRQRVAGGQGTPQVAQGTQGFPSVSAQEQADRDAKAVQMLDQIINSPQASASDKQQAMDDKAALLKQRGVKTAASSGPMVLASATDLQAALQSGKLKKGDVFTDPSGNKHKVN